MRFIFVDRIEKILRNKYARGVKTVSFEEAFLKSPYNIKGYLPRLLVFEAAAQLALWLISFSTDFKKIPLIAKIGSLNINESVRCGSILTLEVHIKSLNDESALINAEIHSNDRLIAEGNECICTFIDLAKLTDRERMMSDFFELSKNAEII